MYNIKLRILNLPSPDFLINTNQDLGVAFFIICKLLQYRLNSLSIKQFMLHKVHTGIILNDKFLKSFVKYTYQVFN